MPVRAKRPCPRPGCPNYQPCPNPAHNLERSRNTQGTLHYRGLASERGYDHRWHKARNRFLAEHPLCGMRDGDLPPVMSVCWEKGLHIPADVVDHIVPHRGDMKRFWDRSGWQSLCTRCHLLKTKAGL